VGVASSFERVREQTGDVAKVSWSNMSILPHYPGANLTGPRQSMVFSGTKRRTRRPSEPRFERDIQSTVARVATRCEQDTEALPFKRSSSTEQDEEINGLIDALGAPIAETSEGQKARQLAPAVGSRKARQLG
jgi:hypothetical protein